MSQTLEVSKRFWEEGGGFFGRHYMEGDNSVEGYLSTPMSLEERTRRELDGIIRLMDLSPGERVLDCPSGYGRHSIGLAERGFKIVGSDINGEMLAPAIKATRWIDDIRFAKENMQEITYRNEFDAVLNLFFSFGFFETDEENQQVLRNFYDALKPSGKFMMHTDINVSRILSGKYKLHEIRHLTSGRQLEIAESYKPEKKRLKGQWILLNPDGTRQELTPYSHRIYTFDEFANACRDAGFCDIAGYGNWEGSPLTSDSEDMIVVARKRLG